MASSTTNYSCIDTMQKISSVHENIPAVVASCPAEEIRVNSKKSVRFAINQNKIYHAEYYIGKVLARNVWYSSCDIVSMKRDSKIINNPEESKLERVQDKDEHEHSSLPRGLGSLEIRISKRERAQLKQDAFDAVMIEQQNQYAACDYQPSLIADAYSQNGAEESQIAAYVRALYYI